MNLPDTILLEIFSYLPLPERWLVASVCHCWNRVCHDPYLYRFLVFENLEYKTLVHCLQKLARIAPRIKSITIKGCYSKFIQNAVVPVQFAHEHQQQQHSRSPTLFSHISALQPPRRREEYLKHKFELHDQFSDVIYQLFQINQDNLNTLKIEDCTLDLEMTELFCTIASHGHALETFYYHNNHDKGIHSSGLLQAIITATPRMKHFRGLHSGMDDAVLLTIVRHWKSLKSLTLCSLKSRSALGQIEIISNGGRALIGSSPVGRISSHVFWQLLCKCNKLDTLELIDLACISNRDLASFVKKRAHLLHEQRIPTRQEKKTRFSPYHIPSIYSTTTFTNYSNTEQQLPGASIKKLLISKFMTTPLSKPGFESLSQLFPQLTELEYETNFHTFDNLFEGVTRDMFNAECAAVQAWCNEHKYRFKYTGKWNEQVTAEQRLMAGMTSVSEDGAAATHAT